MAGYSLGIAADCAGVEPGEMTRLTELGILTSDADVGYSDADVRRVQVVRALERAGLEPRAWRIFSDEDPSRCGSWTRPARTSSRP